MEYKIGKTLISEEKLQAKIKELGERLSKDYAGKQLICVCVLKGAVIFLADLIRNISPEVDVRIDFLAISSYGASTKSSGVVQIQKDLSTDIYGKNVLIIEDIVDTGLSLKYIKALLLERKPQSLAICVLLDKPDRRKETVKVEYTGFTIPDEFVIGYGLDYAGMYRHLPAVFIAEPVA
ncbi:MAG: hypoxanthine phosphoribosyltransferase [Synergistaceae bacterium]|nr:hypoxanthine phosphoribosyltransferase [Synergistaceae bacterium]MCE5183517.1 hypoxanthine phosphoribosyltransferase [Synergistaceae bacterium]